MVSRHEQMGLITLTKICAPHSIIKVAGTLTSIIATTIDIVELKSKAPSLTGIDGKKGTKMILTIGSVSTSIVVNDCYWGVSGCKFELRRLNNEEVIGVEECEMGCSSPIYEYPINTWRPDIAQCIIFTMIARGEDAVHKHFRQSVGHCGLPITETVVYSPHFKATRYILMLALDGIRPSEVTITLIAVGRELSVVSSVKVIAVYLCPGSQG